MNRRHFTTSLAALFATPALPTVGFGATATASSTLPSGARFWASYFAQMHDECTPKMLQSMLRVSDKQASSFISELVAENVITPAQALGRIVPQPITKPTSQLSSHKNVSKSAHYIDRDVEADTLDTQFDGDDVVTDASPQDSDEISS